MKQPALSVLIPVYNTSKYLDACLKSVQAQDLNGMEIICVDDGSTDNSPELLRKYAEQDPRIKIVTHPENQGRLTARHTAVDNAVGEYIMFLDSDDTIDPGLCSAAVDAIQKLNVEILQFSARQIYTEIKNQNVLYPFTGALTGEDILKKFFVSREISTALWINIYQAELCKKAFSEIPEIRSNMGEDAFILFFITYYARSFAGVNLQPKYNYNLGCGITSIEKMSIEKYREYCRMSRFYPIVHEFLTRNQASDLAFKACESMQERLIGDCCSAFAKVMDDQKAEAADLFWAHWSGIPDFPAHIRKALENEQKTIDDIKNSESYRIGNAIVNPLKAVKGRFT